MRHFVRRFGVRLLHQGKQNLRLWRRENLDYPVHLHDAVEIALVLRGESVVLYENKKLPLSAGEIFVAFPNRIHGYEQSRSVEALLLMVPREICLSSFPPSLWRSHPEHPVLTEEDYAKTGLLSLMEQAFSDWSTAPRPVREGYAAVLLGKILSKISLKEEKENFSSALSEILRYINDHYREPLTRRSVAEAVGYNESYLSHLFSEYLNQSFSDYLLHLRLSDAVSLLRSTSENISTIALSLGFGSIRSFNRAFLKAMKVSPRAYRKSTD